jgi:hypothetical protein
MKSTVYKIFQVTVSSLAIVSLLINIFWENGFTINFNVMSYFTLQSNLAVAVVLLLAFFQGNSQKRWLIMLTHGSSIWILVTGVVYHFLLSDTHQPEGIFIATNIIMHYLVPASMIINWIVFCKKGLLKHSFNGIWVGYPIVYSIISLIRGTIDGFYPYWFLNPVKEYPDGAGSILGVLLVTLALVVIFSVIGHIWVLLDRQIKKISDRRAVT